MLVREPYSGPRKLILAFDIGTTYSGVSYCILQPGHIPEILGVTKQSRGDAKVPSVLYYDASGNVKAVGNEALSMHTINDAEENGWTKAEWWKLHLRPKHLASAHIQDEDIPSLPPGKSAVDILTDFLKYLFRATKTYIEEHHMGFNWTSIENSIEFVFSHPNGWEGLQQQKYREAIERASLIPDSKGQSRVHMITEGEASLHFCVSNLHKDPANTKPQAIVIIDAGGGTIDLSVYSVTFNPVACEEIAPAECRLQGAVFVTFRAADLLLRKLQGSSHCSSEEIRDLTREFDRSTKLSVRSADEPVYLTIGHFRYNNPGFNIKRGALMLSGQEATGLFDESIQAIINAFDEQCKAANRRNETRVFLVGGLGSNDFVWTRLRSHFKANGIEICRPDNDINKAVANGAVIFLLDCVVKSRVARVTYGVSYTPWVNQSNPEHLRRKNKWIKKASGRYGEQVDEEKEIRHSFCYVMSNQADFDKKQMTIMCYHGNSSNPQWVDEDSCKLFPAFPVAANNSVAEIGLSGEVYYKVNVDMVMFFGSIELTAQMVWKDNLCSPGNRTLAHANSSRFPGQAEGRGDAKVPSIIYYDASGSIKAIGSEALSMNTINDAEENGWTKAEWWKLHLRPKHLASAHIKDEDIPSLPPRKSAINILTDFIKFLFMAAKTHIEEHHMGFNWISIENSIEFVFSHPNGWEGLQQQKYREAIQSAGLIPGPMGQSRVHMITEGEASLHYCVSSLRAENATTEPQAIIIIDAGGGTIDLSVYSVSFNPIACEEIAPAECRLQGAVFVTFRAADLLLSSSHSSTEEMRDITREFDRSTKLSIRSADEPVYLMIGSFRYNNPRFNIKRGALKLSGEEATSLFNESIQAIIDAFDEQCKAANRRNRKRAFLVGGLGSNDFVWSRLRSYFGVQGIEICRPDNDINKAVANGAVIFHIDRAVKSRVARATYGVPYTPWVDESNPEHLRRKNKWRKMPSGQYTVDGGFCSILRKGDQVDEEKETRSTFCYLNSNQVDFGNEQMSILCYRGKSSNPQWVDEDPCKLFPTSPSFATLGTIRANLRQAANGSVAMIGLSGEVYYRVDIDIVAFFGSTELTAQMVWKENVSHRPQFFSFSLIAGMFPGHRKAVSIGALDFSHGLTAYYGLRTPVTVVYYDD
ncbi:hypothetical protein HD554DRAFT_2025961 [Boletus coccyginus]|nr:hypothetical protein HD554DRAFT_2025961 [Boletus coccyginus]